MEKPFEWERLEGDPPDVAAWLSTMAELQAVGAPLQDALGAFGQFLEAAIQQEQDRYLDLAPQRAQVLFVLFFAPGAFFVLLYPWIRVFL